jgi:hypothetical protein
MSFMFGPMSAAVMRTVPLSLLTAAAGLYMLGRRIGGNVGYAFVASQIDLLDGAVQRQATMMAYNDVFWLMGMLFVLSFPFVLMLNRGSGRTTRAQRQARVQRS